MSDHCCKPTDNTVKSAKGPDAIDVANAFHDEDLFTRFQVELGKKVLEQAVAFVQVKDAASMRTLLHSLPPAVFAELQMYVIMLNLAVETVSLERQRTNAE